MSGRILKDEPEFKNHLKKVPRIEFFSDAVFAIALTILVIDCIETRHFLTGHGKEELFESMYHNWPVYFSFVMGFVTIFVCWVNHYLIFKYIDKVNCSLLWYNGFVLFIVTFIPFPTSIVAEHLERDSHNSLILCGIVYLLAAFAYNSLWKYARKKELITSESEEKKLYIRSLTVVYRFAVVYTIIALGISFISISAGIILYFILLILLSSPKKTAKGVILLKIVKPKS